MNNLPRFLSNGVAIFPKRGQEPPPDMEGYQRRGTNPRTMDAWIFIPQWQECQWRQRTAVARDAGCKCPRIIMYCKHPEGTNTPAELAICNACTLWDIESHQSPIELSRGESVSESIVVTNKRDAKSVTEGFEPITVKGAILPTESSPVSDAEGEDHSVSGVWVEELIK